MSHAALRQPIATDDALSLADWFDLPEDEPGELVGGHLVDEEMPSLIHEILVILLGSLLRSWIVPQGGFVAGSETKFAVSANRGRKPDLSVFFPERPRPSLHGPITVPPDVAVEIVSASPRDGRRDRVEKVNEYAAFGIRYYWILDPQLRSLEILELTPGGSYRHALAVTHGVIDTVPGCSGLTLDLDAVWAEIDTFGTQET